MMSLWKTYGMIYYEASDGKALVESGGEILSSAAQSLKEKQQGGEQLKMSGVNL